MSVDTHSRARPAEQLRSLQWWSVEQQARLAAAVEQALLKWKREWGLGPAEPAQSLVTCVMAFDASNVRSFNVMEWKSAPFAGATVDARQMWWNLSAPDQSRKTVHAIHTAPEGRGEYELLDPVLAALFGAPPEQRLTNYAGDASDMAAQVGRDALASLWRDIGRSLRPEAPLADTTPASDDVANPSHPVPAEYFHPWSGAVVLKLQWCGREMRLLLGPGNVERCLHDHSLKPVQEQRREPATAPTWEALLGLACAVQVELQPIELSLGDIKALRVGDVIGLTHNLDAPLLLKTACGELLCDAFLGRNGEQRAIELSLRSSNAKSISSST
jgi:flagellar motor switch/type III secretory pathway protein FliN